jgi:predicted nicotinamide N-methyase
LMISTDFIQAHLPLTAVPELPGVRLHLAAPSSGLGQLTGSPPYWAYVWAGGMALALHLRHNPWLIGAKRVLDLGAGSGVVGIVAAQAGAGLVLAADCDRNARAATALNAIANGVVLKVLDGDPLRQTPPDVDVVLAGDVFYDPLRAARMLAYLERFAKTGALVLIGDPGRQALPRQRLALLAKYPVHDMGDPPGTVSQGQVFRLDP